MFKKKITEQEISEILEKRKTEMKRMDKLPKLDQFYLWFLRKCEYVEITPDIKIYGYEKALIENRYLDTNYLNIAQIMWMIGETGQGDSWFINKENGSIMFYDHNQGEYSPIGQFVNLNISFFEFLQMAFLYKELEEYIERKNIDKNDISIFIKVINSINNSLYELYPFKYF